MSEEGTAFVYPGQDGYGKTQGFKGGEICAKGVMVIKPIPKGSLRYWNLVALILEKEAKMGRHLSKKDYAIRAKRIVELRDKEGLQFAEIAKRMGILQGVVEYSYHKSKREMNE